MKNLYEGCLSASMAPDAAAELRNARDRLREFPPGQVVWDIEDLSKRPPWGDEISDGITDLSNYFVTSAGRDVFETLIEAVEESTRVGKDATIENY